MNYHYRLSMILLAMRIVKLFGLRICCQNSIITLQKVHTLAFGSLSLAICHTCRCYPSHRSNLNGVSRKLLTDQLSNATRHLKHSHRASTNVQHARRALKHESGL